MALVAAIPARPHSLSCKNGLLNKAIVLAINEVGRNYVEVDDVIIRSLTLPENIVTAIEDKLTQQEYLRSYEFRLETAAKEAQRKINEAKGIQQAQRIIGESLTSEVLAFEGIKATRELAKSQNAKIVVIGSGKNGLPLILGDDAFHAGSTDIPKDETGLDAAPSIPQPEQPQ